MFEVLIYAGLVLGVILGAVLGTLAFFNGRKHQEMIQGLERQLAEIRSRLSATGVPGEQGERQPEQPVHNAAANATTHASTDASTAATEPAAVVNSAAASPASPALPTPATASDSVAADAEANKTADTPQPPTPREPGPIETLFAHMQQNWMAWLGGISLGLAGVFLAIYSIEAGLLGPTARVVVGILLGVALQGSAEYLRRREGQTNTVFAALAAGGSITLFAAILAALHLYELVSQPVAFVGLALVAGSTMALALLHGPLLAALGLLGAYVVPALMGSAGGDRKIVLTYALIVSAGALSLMRYIYRPWLWQGMLVGALGWWLLTLEAASADGARGLYLSIFAYLVLAVPAFDWLLRQRETLAQDSYNLITRWRGMDRQGRDYLVCLSLVVLAQAASVVAERYNAAALVSFTPLLVLALVVANKRESLNILPWLFTVTHIGAWLFGYVGEHADGLQIMPMAPISWWGFMVYAAITAAVTLGGSLYNFGQHSAADQGSGRFVALSASLAALAPLLWLICAYMLTGYPLTPWALGFGALGLIYLVLATVSVRRHTLHGLVVWLYFAGQLALSTAAVLLLQDGALTLVLAVQVVSVVLLMRTFAPVDLLWMVKLFVTALIIRLTINPWLLNYDAQAHWTLWTYGGATALCLLGLWTLRRSPAIATPLRESAGAWLEGAALHLFVLTVWTEVRYWVHGGDVFAGEFSALECSLYALLFGLLSVVYYRRSLVSASIGALYRIFSLLLGGLGLACYALILLATLMGLGWLHEGVSATPIFNLALLYYLAPVVVAWCAWRFGHPPFQRANLVVLGIAGFTFVSMEIRHLWTGSVDLNGDIAGGELVTYSVVWLLMAVVVLLGGAWRWGKRLYQVGMGLLALVIAKIFLVDMSDLEGLLRVGSFFGLGLALLGISYLHQRLGGQGNTDDAEPDPENASGPAHPAGTDGVDPADNTDSNAPDTTEPKTP